MIYLDTSALVKLLVVEAETHALRRWLDGVAEATAISSDLARVELMRTVLRAAEPDLFDPARRLLDVLDLVPLTEQVIALAESIGSADLRSIDALHLAAALQIGAELTAVVTYDRRLSDACVAAGLQVVAPGMDRS